MHTWINETKKILRCRLSLGVLLLKVYSAVAWEFASLASLGSWLELQNVRPSQRSTHFHKTHIFKVWEAFPGGYLCQPSFYRWGWKKTEYEWAEGTPTQRLNPQHWEPREHICWLLGLGCFSYILLKYHTNELLWGSSPEWIQITFPLYQLSFEEDGVFNDQLMFVKGERDFYNKTYTLKVELIWNI